MYNIFPIIIAIASIGIISQTQENYAFADLREGLVIESSNLSDIDNSTLSRIDLKTFDYEEIYQYAALDSETYYVLGGTADGGTRLSSCNMRLNKCSLAVQFGPEYAWSLCSSKFKLFTIQSLQQNYPGILIEYVWGNISPYIDERTKIIEVYLTENGTDYKSIFHDKIAENSWARNRYENPEMKYSFLAVDHSESGPGQLRPATKEVSAIFLTDVNADGFTDILVLKSIFRSKLIQEQAIDDFILDREELFAIYFRNDLKGFSPMRAVEWK